MTKPLGLTLITLSILLLFVTHLLGQAPQPPGLERSRPQQLPLSGRMQTGSVTSDQTSAPVLSTGSVNTLNSSVQIQGAYQGSISMGVPTSDLLPLPLDE